MNWIRPNSDTLRGIFGFLVKTKMKAYTKLTVVMCCQIVARKSVAPSSGDFRRRPAPRYACGPNQEFWRKKSFSKIIITPLLRPRPELRKCVTSMIFKELLVFFCLAGVAGGSPIENLTPFFFVFKKSFFLKHYGDLWSTGKSFV